MHLVTHTQARARARAYKKEHKRIVLMQCARVSGMSHYARARYVHYACAECALREKAKRLMHVIIESESGDAHLGTYMCGAKGECTCSLYADRSTRTAMASST